MSRIASVVLAALLIAGALWFYFNFERVTEREFVDFSGEAARNPMLAFERLVQRMGLTARTASPGGALGQLPAGATLVLSDDREGMTPQGVSRVSDWVSGGGHLIVEAEDADERDALLDALGVVRRELPRGASGKEILLKLPGGSESLRVDMPAMALEYRGGSQSYSAGAGSATALLHFRHGGGRVSVLPSLDFMRNDSIGQYDHAAFAWGLVRLMPDTTQVLIAPRFEQPSLVDWFMEHALGAALAATALLALWLARIGRRFGPVQPPREPRRRRLLEHLRASGHFEWSRGASPTLLDAAREACLAKIARMRPGVSDLPPAERSARLSELTRLPREDIDHALEGAATTQRGFTAAVSTLQQIEEKLTHPVSA